ncbi:RNA polymerase II-associated factor 1 homolog isoform X2 [Carlito syrichta]|uniref:RNA polymerase II-associated factor 1 homolog n=1 Tax=Carlito syrichta TaxID=1868482 RepID=A0A3Q0DX41_CARSF|nr:RNA polymerase II-associated factor 1 homolog isoform X2 [Carlito syrichta]
MAPTIQTQAQREDGHRPNSHRTLPERSGVVCRVKYCNSLPDIPFDPKFITYPFDQNRFVQYKATSLEKQHKHDLLTEPDLGVTIDLINPDTYRIDPNVLLDPADEKLLEEEIQAPTSSKRSQQHAKVVPWMRKTEYISTEFNRYGISNEKPEVKIGVSVKQQFTEEEIYKDRDSQITAIEKTFEDAQKSISQHYSKPRVTPVEVMPVFPDFKMWINPCAQVIFDSDPAPKDTSGAAALEMMSQAMIRGMMDEEGNQFVAYFLPIEETLKKRKRDQEEEMDYAPDDVYDYKIAREYNWNVKNKASKGYEENYFFIFREGDGVYYNELETRVRLSKRRAKAGVQSGTNALLVVKHRDMNEKELEAQEARKAQLENHEPEEEEEEEMEAEEKEAGGSGRAGQARLWEAWEGETGSHLSALFQMRSMKRAAAARRRAVRMSTQAVRVNMTRVTGTRPVTRVAAVRTRAVRMKPGLLVTKRRSSAVMRIPRTMLTLMMRTEDRPKVAATMIRIVVVTRVASGAAAAVAAAVPAPFPVAVSIQARRMAVKLQRPIRVKLTVTVTESQGFWGWHRHHYEQEGPFLVVFVSPSCVCPPPQTFLVNKANFSLLPLLAPVVSFSPAPHPRCSRTSA